MVTINRDYETPGLAGYSVDGETIYLDRRLPKELKLKDGRVIKVDEYLIIHELTEKTLMSKLGYKYQDAHEMAEAAERKAVEMADIPWMEYQRWMEYYIAETAKSYSDIPEDIDLKPERDRGDTEDLSKFRKLIREKYDVQK